MILGSFSFNTASTFTTDHIRKATDCRDLQFQQVLHGGFSGGYYLQKLLPWTANDFFHRDDQNDVMVLLSGSIYNREELAAQCNLTGPVADPELVSRLFRDEGADFVKKLNGDFAIFLWQPVGKIAYLFRDQVGIRSLAYTIDSGALYFSSDTVGLCRTFSKDRNIDSDYLLGYFRYIDYRKTPNPKVIKLPPGHYLEFSVSGSSVKKYWEPEKIREERHLTREKMFSDLKKLVTDAVAIRCDSRFTAGAHVSGGIDSGIIAALARMEYAGQDEFTGFSWSPQDYVAPAGTKYDERELVIKSCRKAGINPLFSEMSSSDFPGIVSSYYTNHGFFSEDSTIDQAVRAKTNLIFSGWGGDEFISTGVSAMEPDLLRRLKFGIFFRRNPVYPPKLFIKRMLFCVVYPSLSIKSRGMINSFKNDARYIKKSFSQSDRKAVRYFHFNTSRHQFHLNMLRFYHLQNRCESWNVNGYRRGVEYRYPLLDRRIIEYMLKVPTELLCKTDDFRPLLRELGDGILPEEVRMNRSKNDPVYWKWMDELFREAAVSFMVEVSVWRANPDLSFVDFDLLTRDISIYKDSPESVQQKVLFRGLVYLKAIHEFTVDYRKSNSL